MTVTIDPGTTRGIYVLREGGEAAAVGDKILGWTDITDAFVPGSIKLTRKKLPTPALVEGCLIKAMDGDERCRKIWDRWGSEANDELRGLMLGATLSYANLALAGS